MLTPLIENVFLALSFEARNIQITINCVHSTPILIHTPDCFACAHAAHRSTTRAGAGGGGGARGANRGTCSAYYKTQLSIHQPAKFGEVQNIHALIHIRTLRAT